MILIHQPTFRFEEDEGYETESFVNKPCGGIASSNRPNSDEFLATDFAPLTQFFRPRKIEKIVEAAVAVFHGQRTDGQTFYMGYFRPSFLPSFFPAKGIQRGDPTSISSSRSYLHGNSCHVQLRPRGNCSISIFVEARSSGYSNVN